MVVVESYFNRAGVVCHHPGDPAVRVKDVGIVAEDIRIESAFPRWHSSTVSLGTISVPFTDGADVPRLNERLTGSTTVRPPVSH